MANLRILAFLISLAVRLTSAATLIDTSSREYADTSIANNKSTITGPYLGRSNVVTRGNWLSNTSSLSKSNASSLGMPFPEDIYPDFYVKPGISRMLAAHDHERRLHFWIGIVMVFWRANSYPGWTQSIRFRDPVFNSGDVFFNPLIAGNVDFSSAWAAWAARVLLGRLYVEPREMVEVPTDYAIGRGDDLWASIFLENRKQSTIGDQPANETTDTLMTSSTNTTETKTAARTTKTTTTRRKRSLKERRANSSDHEVFRQLAAPLAIDAEFTPTPMTGTSRHITTQIDLIKQYFDTAFASEAEEVVPWPEALQEQDFRLEYDHDDSTAALKILCGPTTGSNPPQVLDYFLGMHKILELMIKNGRYDFFTAKILRARKVIAEFSIQPRRKRGTTVSDISSS